MNIKIIIEIIWKLVNLRKYGVKIYLKNCVNVKIKFWIFYVKIL